MAKLTHIDCASLTQSDTQQQQQHIQIAEVYKTKVL